MQLGGAYGFLSEGGPGASPMLLRSLETVLPASKLWPINDEWNWHCGNQVGLFGNLRFFTPPLYARYGTATSAADYAFKAQVRGVVCEAAPVHWTQMVVVAWRHMRLCARQMASYESHRAMFEAYSRNKYTSTGVVQWMLNSAFPSNMWNLYDPSLRQGGAYVTRATECILHVRSVHTHTLCAGSLAPRRRTRGCMPCTATTMDLCGR